jgi:hypothetical protein
MGEGWRTKGAAAAAEGKGRRLWFDLELWWGFLRGESRVVVRRAADARRITSPACYSGSCHVEVELVQYA